MIRKYNYTGRIRIPKELVRIRHTTQNGTKSFDAKLNLLELGFPREAKVYIEPYFKASFMRFDFGKVSEVTSPPSTELTDIPITDRVQYRIKIVDGSVANGKILGFVDEILPIIDEGSGDKKPLLPVDFNDLGSQIWRLDFRGDGPVLEVNHNDKIENIREIVKDPRFVSLVYPEVVRQIIRRILDDDENSIDDPSGWVANWLTFFNKVLNIAIKSKPATTDEEELIENLIEAFCKRHDVIFQLTESYAYTKTK